MPHQGRIMHGVGQHPKLFIAETPTGYLKIQVHSLFVPVTLDYHANRILATF